MPAVAAYKIGAHPQLVLGKQKVGISEDLLDVESVFSSKGFMIYEIGRNR
jgi:hypothetical protein